MGNFTLALTLPFPFPYHSPHPVTVMCSRISSQLELKSVKQHCAFVFPDGQADPTCGGKPSQARVPSHCHQGPSALCLCQQRDICPRCSANSKGAHLQWFHLWGISWTPLRICWKLQAFSPEELASIQEFANEFRWFGTQLVSHLGDSQSPCEGPPISKVPWTCCLQIQT